MGHSDEAREVLEGLLVGTLKRQVFSPSSLGMLIGTDDSFDSLEIHDPKSPALLRINLGVPRGLVWELACTQ